ncbi:MAG TPA: cytochrome P450 [Acidimicrobiales bacterium]|nr:cytochrome P450 [Acidimicrobiales bacterium]
MTTAPAPDPAALALFQPSAAADPHPVYEQLRAGVASMDIGMGPLVLISGYKDVHHALRHPELFSSAEDPIDLGTSRPLIPLQVDPPGHARYRRLLDPLFSPRATDAMEPDIRELARRLLDGFAGRDGCDIHTEFSVPFPCTIFLRLFGLPLEHLDQFLAWKDAIIRPSVDDPFDIEATRAVRDRAGSAIDSYFEGAIGQRRRAPGDDLLSRFVTAEVGGERLDEDEVLGMCYLFLLGGLDTVTASLDCMVARLATHPAERRRLVEEPSLVASAVEELLRFETPVTVVPRTVKTPTAVGGHDLPAGTHVMLVLGAADTDERVFCGADRVDFDRDTNRHFAFGAGPHRCLGSHLARRELRVAIEELHRRIPDYAVAPGASLTYTLGIRQIDHLPLVFGGHG